MNLSVRALTENDWAAIDDIQKQVYPKALYEDISVLKQKHAVAPESCWVAVDIHDQVQGYLFAHRWANSKQPPSLNTAMSSYAGDLLYLHDLAMASDAQGHGLTRHLWQTFVQYARHENLTQGMLVAVNGSVPYWQYKGFEIQAPVDTSKGYGSDATLMVTRLA
jgi:GNAT superfamily N-acetyltransferase